METFQKSVDFDSVVNTFDFDISSYSKDLKKFVVHYFACVPISNELLVAVIDYCTDYSAQISLVTNVIASSIWDKFCGKSHCHTKILKYIIERLEERHVEVCEGLYHSLVNSLREDGDFGHRIYLNSTFTKFIALKEKSQQISNGTTGLSCWQASCDLAHYLLGVGSSLLDKRDVVELGSGCGLAGIAVAATGRARSVTLTDCNSDVLQLLKENCGINFSEAQMSQLNISVRRIDWCDYIKEDIATITPNLIIASDVLFDSQLAVPLVSLISKLFRQSAASNAECIIAGVVRNEETYNAFLEAYNDYHLKVLETFTFRSDEFIYEENRCVKDESNFLFSSSLSLPTVFQRLRSAA